jgi:transcriptional regulator with XRE-family HTH domain
LSQEALAEAAELHWTYISGVERGVRSPTLNVIGRIAKGLGVEPVELFRWRATDTRQVKK